jgi:DnaK suppressor protein
LEKLDEGNFGVCEKCGREISEERLKVRPMAVLCIRCKKKQEASEKMRGL